MAKDYQSDSLGEINITTNVLETIAAEAARRVEGVEGKSNSFQREVGSFFGIDREHIGAKVHQDEYGISVDVEIIVQYGYSVPDVAIHVQDYVREKILEMTDLVVQEVNVHVIGMHTEPKSTDFLHLDETGDISE